MIRHHVLSGADQPERLDAALSGRRIGLMTNPTGVDHRLRSTVDLLHARFRLTALFAPEHGLRGDLQAGAAVKTVTDPETGIPVYSAYGENSHFTPEMLDAFDVLVFDIQDVGARFYTYLYSLSYAMESCAKAGKKMVVLDRVNPLGGLKRAGTILDPAFASFVGNYELPTRYGLTIGEYARYVRDYLKLDLDLTVLPLVGWQRWMLLDDTDLPWVLPSPNLPTLESALCYTGTCIFEGTNCSEGRGTTIPFQVVGAPYVDGSALEKRMAEIDTPGIHFRRASFCPTFSKHESLVCHGVQMHILDRDLADPTAAGLLLCEAIRDLYPNQFEMIHWEGEREFAIDKLLGTDAFRTGQKGAEALIREAAAGQDAFGMKTEKYHLYQ